MPNPYDASQKVLGRRRFFMHLALEFVARGGASGGYQTIRKHSGVSIAHFYEIVYKVMDIVIGLPELA